MRKSPPRKKRVRKSPEETSPVKKNSRKKTSKHNSNESVFNDEQEKDRIGRFMDYLRTYGIRYNMKKKRGYVYFFYQLPISNDAGRLACFIALAAN